MDNKEAEKPTIASGDIFLFIKMEIGLEIEFIFLKQYTFQNQK